MDKAQVLHKVEPLTEIRVRPLDNPDFKVDYDRDGGTLQVRPTQRGRWVKVDPESNQEFLTYAGVPDQLAKRLEMPTIANVVNEALHHHSKGVTLLERNGEVTGIAPMGQYTNVSPDRVLGAIDRGIGEEVEYDNAIITGNSVQLQIVGLEERAVAVGDVVRAGVTVDFSPIGATDISVSPYTRRLVCTNGMQSTQTIHAYRMGDDGGSPWDFLRKSSRASYRMIDRIVTRYQELLGEEVSDADRAAAITGLIDSMKPPKQIGELIRTEAINNPPRNAWELMNLGTWATSHHMAEFPARRMRAQRAIGGWVDAETHDRVCPSCHRRN